MPKLAIFFRGDSRAPDICFKTGFQPKNPTKGRPFMVSEYCAGDNAVCVTPELARAVPFPVTQDQFIWIYVIAVDVEQNDETRLLNLYAKEIPSVATENIFLFNFTLESTKECLVDDINSNAILGAFPIERIFTNGVPKEVQTVVFSFKVIGSFVKNEAGQPLLNQSPELASALNDVIKTYAKQPNTPTHEFEDTYLQPGFTQQQLRRVAFYAGSKFSTDLVPTKPPKRSLTREKRNEAFFSSKQFTNSSGIFFTPAQLARENTLFYASVKKGAHDQAIQSERKKLNSSIDESTFTLFTNFIDKMNPPPDRNKKTAYLLETYFDPNKEMLPKTLALLKR